ncbi:hypothetical protein TNCV_3146171 [Trichonephila clavipes]|nr:hypothetical protein TNCV_3146171 [Trichonephila clavipes]
MTDSLAMDTSEGLTVLSDSKLALEAIINGKPNIPFTLDFLLEQLQYKEKSCVLQYIPAHVYIEGNACADYLAKEARNHGQPSHLLTQMLLPDLGIYPIPLKPIAGQNSIL